MPSVKIRLQSAASGSEVTPLLDQTANVAYIVEFDGTFGTGAGQYTVGGNPWEIFGPDGSDDTFDAGGGAGDTGNGKIFTPEYPGRYLFRLTATPVGGAATRYTALLEIADPHVLGETGLAEGVHRNTSFPASNESSEYDPDEGWSRTAERYFRAVSELYAGNRMFVAKATAAITQGQVASILNLEKWKGSTASLTKFNNFVHTATPAASVADLTGDALVLAMEGVANGARGKFFAQGLLPFDTNTHFAGASVGDSVYLKADGTLTKTKAGSTGRVVGTIMRMGADTDTNPGLLNFDGLTGSLPTAFQGAVGASTDNAMVRWDGTTGAAIQDSANGPFALDDGKLGVGTNSPNELLEVFGNVRIGNGGGGTHLTYNATNLYFSNLANGVEAGIINGTFSIGAHPNTDTSQALHVVGDTTIDGVLKVTEIIDPKGFAFDPQAANPGTSYSLQDNMLWQDSQNDYLGTSIPKLMFADKPAVMNFRSDPVGIGTASPAAKLHVEDLTEGAEVVRVKGFDGTFGIEGHKVTFDRAAANYITATSTSGEIRLESGGAGNVTALLSSDQRVGLGTLTPATKLHVKHLTHDEEVARFEGFDGTLAVESGHKLTFSRGAANYLTATDLSGYFVFETGSAGNERVRITADGKVGIGTTSPAEALHVAGNLKVDGNIDFRSSASATRRTLFADTATTRASVGKVITETPRASFEVASTTADNNASVAQLRLSHTEDVTDGSGNVTSAGAYAQQRVTSSGHLLLSTTGDRVGIGNMASPASTFHVEAAADGAKQEFTHASSGSTWFTQYSSGNGVNMQMHDATNTRTVFIRSYGDSYFTGGKLGVGIASPTYFLDLAPSVAEAFRIKNSTSGRALNCAIENKGTSATDGVLLGLYAEPSAGDAALRFAIAGNETWSVGIDNSDNDKFKISQSSTLHTDTRLTIQGNRVGINNDAPTTALDVSGDVTVTGSTFLGTFASVTGSGSSDGVLQVTGGETRSAFIKLRADDSDDAGDQWTIMAPDSANNNSLVIGNNIANQSVSAAHFTITPNATVTDSVVRAYGKLQVDNRVGIGTSTPDQALDVFGNIRLGNGGGGAHLMFNATNLYFNNVANGIQASIINGNFGIGTTSPAQKLDVSGDAKLSGVLYIAEEQSTSPSAPADGAGGVLYTKADGKLYWASNDLGADIDLTASGGGGSGITSLTLSGDSGSSQAIANGNTITVAGGTGIDTVAGATDTVTVNIDSTVATLTGSQTLTNKTVNLPTIGGMKFGSIQTISSSYTCDSRSGISDDVILCDVSGGNLTVTLPAVSAGRCLHIKDSSGSCSNTNFIRIAPASGTVDGQGTRALTNPYSAVTLICDGTNWFIF